MGKRDSQDKRGRKKGRHPLGFPEEIDAPVPPISSAQKPAPVVVQMPSPAPTVVTGEPPERGTRAWMETLPTLLPPEGSEEAEAFFAHIPDL